MTSPDFLLPVAPLDTVAMADADQRWASRAIPPGALGRLQALGAHLAGVTGTCPPQIERPAVAVFAGDHGVVADGASAWPSEITGMMVATMATGAAAINVLAEVVGAPVTLVDVGVANPTDGIEGVQQQKVRAGTDSIAKGPAMSVDEATEAIHVGWSVANQLVADGHDCLVGGEMGIGNTTPSAAIIAVCSGEFVDSLIGPGAGLRDEDLPRKQQLVSDALDRLAGDETGVELLAQIGGLEIAALAGFYCAAAAARVPFVIDGVIAAAALCAAERLVPGVAALAVAGHQSSEPAATAALLHLGLDPLLDLDLRLGEGTGACLAVPLLQAACRTMARIADLPEL